MANLDVEFIAPPMPALSKLFNMEKLTYFKQSKPFAVIVLNWWKTLWVNVIVFHFGGKFKIPFFPDWIQILLRFGSPLRSALPSQGHGRDRATINLASSILLTMNFLIIHLSHICVFFCLSLFYVCFSRKIINFFAEKSVPKKLRKSPSCSWSSAKQRKRTIFLKTICPTTLYSECPINANQASIFKLDEIVFVPNHRE